MRKPRRKCTVCREWFYPARSEQYVCSYECACVHGKAANDAAKAEKQRKEKKRRQEEEKADRKRMRERRIALKTKPQWRKEAQDAFNRYVRLRDAGKPCISCGRMPDQKFGGTMDCGHYRTRGAAAHLAFNLFNTAAQCVYCNRDRAGAQKAFEKGLIERIGAERVEDLNNNNTVRKFDITYFQRIKSIFTRRARQLEKRRARHQEAA